MTKWKFFIPTCLIATVFLLQGGAPIFSIIGGVAVAAAAIWFSGRKASSIPR
jgi:hypothetical protein